MTKRIYNLIYACYWELFGWDGDYENAEEKEYEQFAIEMLERIQEELGKEQGEANAKK